MFRKFPRRTLLVSAALAALVRPALIQPAYAGSQFSLGVEGFVDRYREPSRSVGVTTESAYGSVTASYTYTTPSNWFIGADIRGSYGNGRYKSPSGTSNGTPQYEGDVRVKFGASIEGLNGTLSPYIGLGWRTFLDNGAGTQTNLGYYGYDRQIDQTYIPIGASYTYRGESGWTYSPMAEFDTLIYGRVNSKIGPITGFDISNKQHNGYGARGEFMFGHSLGSHEIQIGPFVRYWTVQDSKRTPDPSRPGWYFYEPDNTRLQAGMAVRLKL